MGIIPISDADDVRLADYRNVPEPELIARRGLFVAEGRLVVRRLLIESGWTIRSLALTDAALASLESLLVTRPSLPVYVVPQSVINGVTGFNIHRGCLAIGERRPNRPWTELAESAGRLVALEGVGNADNVGSVFRNAAAFGVDGVLVGPSCADPLYRKAIRTSMGAVLTVPFAQADPWPDVLTDLTRRGWAVVALTPSARAQRLRDVVHAVRGSPVAIVLGHEGEGLSAAALAACRYHARIPIVERVDSLNVATAAAIALYELAELMPRAHLC